MLGPEQWQHFKELSQQEHIPRVMFGRGVAPDTSYAKWICLYPSYIDAEKTRPQGRRVAAKNAVAAPLMREIVEAADKLGIRYVVEDKAYSRDALVRGRIRLCIFEDDGRTVVNPSFASRKMAMEKISTFLVAKRLERKSGSSSDAPALAATPPIKQKKKKK